MSTKAAPATPKRRRIDGLAVAADEGRRLLVDLEHGVHLLIGIEHDLVHPPRPGAQDLDIGADFQPGDAGRGQDQTQLGGRLEPLAQHAGLQRRDQQQRDRRDHQRADPFVGVAQPDHAAALIADRP